MTSKTTVKFVCWVIEAAERAWSFEKSIAYGIQAIIGPLGHIDHTSLKGPVTLRAICDRNALAMANLGKLQNSHQNLSEAHSQCLADV